MGKFIVAFIIVARLETSQMSIHSRMENEIMEYSYKGIQHSSIDSWVTATQHSIHEPPDVEGKKPDVMHIVSSYFYRIQTWTNVTYVVTSQDTD